MQRPGERGFSLAELLIAMTLGLLLAAAFIAVLDQCRRASAANESVAQLQETARHVLDALVFEIEHAGFFAGADPRDVRLVRGEVPLAAGPELQQPGGSLTRTPVAGLPAGAHDCGTNFAVDLERGVQGANGTWPPGRDARSCAPTAAAGGVRSGADALVVRHASLAVTEPHAGRLQLYTRRDETHASALLFADGHAPGVADVKSEIRDVEVRSYYVANNSVGHAGFPALRVKALTEAGGGAQFRDEEVMPGIEDLQVEFCVLDASGGAPRLSYVAADSPALRTLPVTAVRLWLRVRAETSDAGYLDARTLQYAGVEFTPTALEARQRRLLVERTIALRNARPP